MGMTCCSLHVCQMERSDPATEIRGGRTAGSPKSNPCRRSHQSFMRRKPIPMEIFNVRRLP